MAYEYENEKQKIFSESGQKLFLKIRDNVGALIDTAGAFAMHAASKGCSGDSWTMLAAVDRLVELGEIKEVPRGDIVGQFRIFVRPRE